MFYVVQSVGSLGCVACGSRSLPSSAPVSRRLRPRTETAEQTWRGRPQASQRTVPGPAASGRPTPSTAQLADLSGHRALQDPSSALREVARHWPTARRLQRAGYLGRWCPPLHPPPFHCSRRTLETSGAFCSRVLPVDSKQAMLAGTSHRRIWTPGTHDRGEKKQRSGCDGQSWPRRKRRGRARSTLAVCKPHGMHGPCETRLGCGRWCSLLAQDSPWSVFKYPDTPHSLVQALITHRSHQHTTIYGQTTYCPP